MTIEELASVLWQGLKLAPSVIKENFMYQWTNSLVFRILLLSLPILYILGVILNKLSKE